jgi:hypothetical protein
MDQQVKSKWLEALRSGDFEQGKRWLHANGEYCCLGVLCEIAAEEGVVTVGRRWQIITYDGVGNLLPQSVVDWAGLDTPWGWQQEDGSQGYIPSLTSMNDEGVPFPEIADFIEKVL